MLPVSHQLKMSFLQPVAGLRGHGPGRPQALTLLTPSRFPYISMFKHVPRILFSLRKVLLSTFCLSEI